LILLREWRTDKKFGEAAGNCGLGKRRLPRLEEKQSISIGRDHGEGKVNKPASAFAHLYIFTAAQVAGGWSSICGKPSPPN